MAESSHKWGKRHNLVGETILCGKHLGGKNVLVGELQDNISQILSACLFICCLSHEILVNIVAYLILNVLKIYLKKTERKKIKKIFKNSYFFLLQNIYCENFEIKILKIYYFRRCFNRI